MDHIETRTQLIEFIADHIGRSAIERACSTGKVKVLGGFSLIPPSTEPGWIVAITSVHGRTWYIAMSPDFPARTFKVYMLPIGNCIPWKYYIGRSDRNEYSIYDGDDPARAELARDNYVEKYGKGNR